MAVQATLGIGDMSGVFSYRTGNQLQELPCIARRDNGTFSTSLASSTVITFPEVEFTSGACSVTSTTSDISPTFMVKLASIAAPGSKSIPRRRNFLNPDISASRM